MHSLDHLAAVGLGRVVEVVVIYVRAWCHHRGDALVVHPEHAGNERLLMLTEFPLLHQRFDLFVCHRRERLLAHAKQAKDRVARQGQATHDRVRDPGRQLHQRRDGGDDALGIEHRKALGNELPEQYR